MELTYFSKILLKKLKKTANNRFEPKTNFWKLIDIGLGLYKITITIIDNLRSN